MAKQTVVQYVDDLDGKELTDPITVRYALDGKSYEFDTSAAHAKEFHKMLDKYLAVSRRSGVVKSRLSAGSGRQSKEQTQAIREWARKNGYDVSDRGRIPLSIMEAFDSAH